MATEVLKGERKNKCKAGQKVHQIFTYPAPQGAPLKDDYEVYIKSYGEKEYHRIDTYMAKANASTAPTSVSGDMPQDTRSRAVDTGHSVSEISYCFFDFTGDVDIKVMTKGRKFKTARIRPDRPWLSHPTESRLQQ